jgi:hypothetical protein
MKRLAIVFGVILASTHLASAFDWSESFEGSLYAGNTEYYSIAFPREGTLTVSCPISGGSGSVYALLLRSGSVIYNNSGSTGSVMTMGPIEVWPNETYTLQINCTYGSVSFTANMLLTYLPNSDPVINSVTASPNPADYGTSVSVNVNATDVDGNLSRVSFSSVGGGGTPPDDFSSPYSHKYPNDLCVGSYQVTTVAYDALAKSATGGVSFVVTPRQITVRAKGGRSVFGTIPSTGTQGLELVCGSLVGNDTLQSIGLSLSNTIGATTPIGRYSIDVCGVGNVNYSVNRVSGFWVVENELEGGMVDSDCNGIDDRMEMLVVNGTGNDFARFFSDGDGDAYLDCVDSTVSGFSSENTLSTRLPSSGGGPLIVLPDRGIYEISVNSFTLNRR